MVNKMDIREFVDQGYLQELNRCFLHPLGLALEVEESDDGEFNISGVWDYRHDPEGIVYVGLDEESATIKANRVKTIMRARNGDREAMFGFDIQPVDSLHMSLEELRYV